MMSFQNNQHARLARISELISLRDDIQHASQVLAGKANSLGFAMHMHEKVQQYVRIAEWVKSCLNFSGQLTYLTNTLLERLRKRKSTSAPMKKLLLATEALVYWGKIAFDIASSPSPTTAIKVTVSMVLKGLSIQSLDNKEKLKRVMDEYWQASKDFQECLPAVVAELNREISSLR